MGKTLGQMGMFGKCAAAAFLVGVIYLTGIWDLMVFFTGGWHWPAIIILGGVGWGLSQWDRDAERDD